MRPIAVGSAGRRRLWYATVAVLLLGGVVLSLVGGATRTRQPVRRPAGVEHPGRTRPKDPAPAHASTRRSAGTTSSPRMDAARMLGQMIVARFPGRAPTAGFLARIKAGQIGAVILFGDNVAGGLNATREVTRELQSAASTGGNPPLLIMTDQEGGEVSRLPGPPTLAPADMTSTRLARAQGQAAGRLLRSAGVDVDLAPVADVEGTPGSFLGTRSFGHSPATVARDACAFARGLSSEHVAYTLKHFPGLGLATGDTDFGSVSVTAPAGVLRAAYRAYESCGSGPLGMVMVSSASYPALSGSLPAVMSPEIYHHELALAVPGGSPLTISDDLQTPAIESHSAPARHAIQAGLDLLMYAETEQGSAEAYAKLLSEVHAGVIPRARLVNAERRIEALKSRLGQ